MSDIAERLVMEGLAAYSNEIQMRLTEQKPEKKTVRFLLIRFRN